MFSSARSKLTYANVMSTIAVFLAVGGGTFALAVAKKNSVTSTSIRNGQVKTKDLGQNAVRTPKIADAAVTTPKVADGAITTPKLANNAATSDKLAANSVSGLKQITDGTITGSDVLENSLTFGCAPLLPAFPTGTGGPYRIATNGYCAFVLHPATSRTWSQAADDCSGSVPDATLAEPVQVSQLQSSNGGSQGPVTGTVNIWSPDPATGTQAWTTNVGNGGAVTGFAAVPITTSNPAPIVCVYQPASKNG